MMERTRHYISDDGKLLLAARSISLCIPALSHFHDYYDEYCGYDAYGLDGDGVPGDLREEMTNNICCWMDKMDKVDQSNIMINLIRLRNCNSYAFELMKELAGGVYKNYFNSVPPTHCKTLPSIMVRSGLMYFARNKSWGSNIHPDHPIIKWVGGTKTIIRGTIPFAGDYKTCFALMNIMKQRENEIEGLHNIVYFTVSLKEIAKEMGSTNPSSKTVQQAILNSLIRLVKCVMIWDWKDKTGRHHIKVGGVLSQLEDEGQEGEYGIYLNMNFIWLYRFGYLQIDRDVFYKLSESEILMYLSVIGELNQYGRFGGKKGYDISNVHYRANLGGFVDTEKTKAQKRHEVKQVLKRLEKRLEKNKTPIRSSITDDKLKIFWKRKVISEKV